MDKKKNKIPNSGLKDSGNRTILSGGMKRDMQDGVERFELLIPEKMPYDKTYLYRIAKHYSKGAKKYNDRNWERACSQDNYDSFKQSAFRHFMKIMSNETSEDHEAALFFNIQGMIYTKWRMEND